MVRPYLIKLLGRGAIPFERVGADCRLTVDDERQKQLDELSRLSQELEGEYR